MTPGRIVPHGTDVVTPGSVHKPTLDIVLKYLPAVLEAVTDALTINREVGHEDLTKIIIDSVTAGAQVAGDIPDSHVQVIGALAGSIAGDVVKQRDISDGRQT